MSLLSTTLTTTERNISSKFLQFKILLPYRACIIKKNSLMLNILSKLYGYWLSFLLYCFNIFLEKKSSIL